MAVSPTINSLKASVSRDGCPNTLSRHAHGVGVRGGGVLVLTLAMVVDCLPTMMGPSLKQGFRRPRLGVISIDNHSLLTGGGGGSHVGHALTVRPLTMRHREGGGGGCSNRSDTQYVKGGVAGDITLPVQQSSCHSLQASPEKGTHRTCRLRLVDGWWSFHCGGDAPRKGGRTCLRRSRHRS